MRATNKKRSGAGRRRPGSHKASKRNNTDVSAAAQIGRLLHALKKQALTTLQARRELDVLHPAMRILELKRSGHEIHSSWTHDFTSEGHRHRVARYELVGESRQRELAFGAS